jgi:hypothetical protein
VNEIRKRWLILGSGAAVCLGLGLALSRLRPTYWAYSTVTMRPFTNVVPARALQGPFQRQVRKAVPSIRRLTVNPSFANSAAALAWSTNKTASGTAVPLSADLRIMTLGSSPEQAQVAANAAAARLCTFLLQQYGGSVTIVSNADMTGRYSLPSEVGLQIERLIQR